MKKFLREEEMAKKVIEYLYDLKWEIYQEVDTKPIGGIVDIIAIQNNIMWALECKLSFSLAVIRQAEKHVPYANYVSICTPFNSSSYPKILNFLHLGHLSVGYNSVYEEVIPKLNRAISRGYWNKLCEEQRTFCAAGAAGGGHFTPFKKTVLNFKSYIRTNPGCSMKEVMTSIKHHYGCPSTARTSMYTWLREGVIDGVILKKGKLYLNE